MRRSSLRPSRKMPRTANRTGEQNEMSHFRPKTSLLLRNSIVALKSIGSKSSLANNLVGPHRNN